VDTTGGSFAGSKPGTFRGLRIEDLTAPMTAAAGDVYGVQVQRFDAVVTAGRYPFFYGDAGGTMYWGVKEVTGGPVGQLPQYGSTRPTAAAAGAGSMIYCTTHDCVEVSDGTNWDRPSSVTTH
jgi:hypothetical protein